MKPNIRGTGFGSITIGEKMLDYDVVIHMNGHLEKRKEPMTMLSHGTSDVLSLDEAKRLYEKGAEHLIIGTGMRSMLHLSDEAKAFFAENKCMVDLWSTPHAIDAWNKEEGKKTIGLFHVT